MTKFSTMILMWMLLLAFGATAQVKDYSDRGPDFTPLRDIRLGLSLIEYAGRQPVSVEGQILDAAKYKIVSPDIVPFEQGVHPYNNVMKDLDVHYELLVAKDVGSKVHDRLISVLKEVCGLPAAQRDFSDVGMAGERGQYLMYSGKVSMPNYVWFDGRVVIVRFVRLGEKRIDRPLDTETFWKEKIRFYPGGQRLHLSKPPKSFAKAFLDRYAAGEFIRSGT